MSTRNNILSRAGLILGYKHFYTNDPPENRISLIKHIPKTEILFLLAAFNYKIKSPRNIFFNHTPDTQLSHINDFFNLSPDIFKRVKTYYEFCLENISKDSLVFTRIGFIYAINEIIECGEMTEFDGFQSSSQDFEKIFKYLLIINDEITSYKNSLMEPLDYSQIEKLNLALLPLNEYFLPIDPLLIFFRGGSLFEYLNLSDIYKDKLRDYIQTASNLDPQRFIYELVGMYMTNHMGVEDGNFYYHLPVNDDRFKLFEFFSARKKLKSASNFEMLTLRKFPFYKKSKDEYFLLDNMFILQKSYDFFIWDFLNDYLLLDAKTEKERKKIIQDFKSELGYFFEKYISTLLIESFSHKKFHIRSFEELKIKIKKEEIELGDIYVRSNNNILIGEAKTTSIINREKYAEDLNEFYNNKPEKFFKNHGVLQLANHIRDLLNHGKLIDGGFPSKRIKFFPIIVFNDPMLNNILFSQIFSDKFSELISDFNDKCATIMPLTLVHISDLEILEKMLSSTRIDIFKIIKEHHRNSVVKMPFYITTNRFEYRNYSDRIDDYYRGLIAKYHRK